MKFDESFQKPVFQQFFENQQTTPTIETPTVDTSSFDFDLSTVSSLAGMLGSYMANKEDKKYKSKMLEMEEQRVARERKKEDTFNAGFKEAYK